MASLAPDGQPNGYHTNHIARGVFGEFSKIREEFLESEDAVKQGIKIMVMCELSDLIGAIEGFAVSSLGCSLEDLLQMKEATHRAFNSGARKPK